jgi:hypothetical protein
MSRFWKPDYKRKWKSYAHKRLVGHYRGLARRQRPLLRKLLKEARLDNKLNQKEAGKLLGQDQMFISKIESGKRQVEFVEVEHFAQIYGKRLSFFSTLHHSK